MDTQSILKILDQILVIITHPVFASLFTAGVMAVWAKYNPIKVICWLINQMDDRIIDKLPPADKAKIQKEYDLIIEVINKVKAD